MAHTLSTQQITDEQKEWLDHTKKETFKSYNQIIRDCLQEKVDKWKKEKNK